MRFSALGVAGVALLALAASGCTSSRFTSVDTPTAAPAPLPAAPSGSVSSNSLPPPAQPNQFPTAPPPVTPSTTDMAAATPAAANPSGGADITKSEMVGSWQVGGGQNCQVFMTLTKLGNASRGGSRGCSGDLQRMKSWEVRGKQVVLYDDAGNQLAALYSSGGNRYDGQTSGGQPISFSR